MKIHIDWSSAGTVYSENHKLYYIQAHKLGNKNEIYFLHSDGSWRFTLCNDDGGMSGYYINEYVAKNTIKRYMPKITLEELAPGTKFKFAAVGLPPDIFMKISRPLAYPNNACINISNYAYWEALPENEVVVVQ